MNPDLRNLAQSHAILIGVSSYEDPGFPRIPAVRDAVSGLRRVLIDPALGGLPTAAVQDILDPASVRDIVDAVTDLTKATMGALIVYFQGYVTFSGRGEFGLTVSTTRSNHAYGTAVPWSFVAAAIRASPAKVKIVVLDCCFAGWDNSEVLSGPLGTTVADLTQIEGVCTLTATTRYHSTRHFHDASSASFTGELIDLITTGISDGPAGLTLESIYLRLRDRLIARNLPDPNIRAVGIAGRFIVARNAAHREVAEDVKPGPSVGAWWAQSFRDRAVGLEDAKGDLASRRTSLIIDVDNLPLTLPCACLLQRLGSDELELLRAGTEVYEVDDAGTIGVRSRWVGLMPDFQVNQPEDYGISALWARFDYKRRAAREGFRPNDIWVPNADGVVDAAIRAQLEVEVTKTLIPFLNLCQERPHYLMPSEPTISLGSHFGGQYWLGSKNRLTGIPAAIWVSGQPDREHPDGKMELFGAWRPGLDGAATTFFPESFRDSGNPQLEPRPGRVSAQLPRPDERGEYRFFLRWPGGREDLVSVQPVEYQPGPMARFVATLDTRAWLTIHRGNPPYWKAGSLEEVQRNAGSVFRAEMEYSVRDPENS